MTRTAWAISGVFVLLGVSACAGGAPRATPHPVPPATADVASAGQPALPHSGAPKIDNPLPDTALEGDPCRALTPAQVKELLGTDATGEGDRIATGPICQWRNPQRGSAIVVNFVTEVHEGLSALYKNVKPRAGVWREVQPIQGLPAVVHSIDEMPDPPTDCQVAVGVSDTRYIDFGGGVASASVGEVDACEAVEQLGGKVLATLQQGAAR